MENYTKILCDMTECIYYVYCEDKGDAYKHQCENDEVEISIGETGKPECYSYDCRI